MKYKVGDKVRVKSLEWYNKNKSEFGDVRTPNNIFVPNMSIFCGKEVTISGVALIDSNNVIYYSLKEDTSGYGWTDDMFEGLVESNELNKEQDNEQTFNAVDDVDCVKPVVFENIVFPNENYADKVELCLGDDYEIVVEDNRTFIQKKKPKYPKTFIEVLNFWHPDRQIEDDYQIYYKKDLIEKFQNLLYARDAYWKIAGEEMGLGKPWVPDWSVENEIKYVIEVYRSNVRKNSQGYSNTILAFPTKEMRDAFYDNFKELIEKCKELL